MKKPAIFCLILLLFFQMSTNVSASDYSETEVSDEDIELIIRLTHFETEGEPLLCKLAFAAVIFNRVQDEYFPSNVHDVVYDAGAFDSTKRKDFMRNLSYCETSDDEIAVKYVYSKGIDPTCGALFVMKKDNVHLWEITPTFQIGDYIFGNLP